ncbi:hypothetical protein RIF29_26928 [Crotalaria pallida]|uniref:Uncharacterized protein n=1 Tax=Crotalaria pallida TaxID=3830 RepID=A0AAN9I545_CROPI
MVEMGLRRNLLSLVLTFDLNLSPPLNSQTSPPSSDVTYNFVANYKPPPNDSSIHPLKKRIGCGNYSTDPMMWPRFPTSPAATLLAFSTLAALTTARTSPIPITAVSLNIVPHVSITERNVINNSWKVWLLAETSFEYPVPKT